MTESPTPAALDGTGLLEITTMPELIAYGRATGQGLFQPANISRFRCRFGRRLYRHSDGTLLFVVSEHWPNHANRRYLVTHLCVPTADASGPLCLHDFGTIWHCRRAAHRYAELVSSGCPPAVASWLVEQRLPASDANLVYAALTITLHNHAGHP